MSSQTLVIFVSVLLVSCATRWVPAARTRQGLLLAGSYFMYAHLAGAWYLALLIASSLMNYCWGVLLRRRPTASLLGAGIASNVLLLAFFKYLPPLAGVWPGALSGLDFVQQIVLPLGVSFWTFQALSYLIDTYLEEELEPSVLEFCLYMSFWPTVASGPVCRLHKMLPRFRKLPGSFREDFSIGAVRIVQGLFMKFVLSQLLAAGITGGGVTAGFNTAGVQRSGLDVWVLAVGFGFQLFFDFAGYSHIVIGAARMVGIQLEENFNRPYLSTTPAVFWTRCHMSLSFWIRDYLYAPLTTLWRNRWWHHIALVIAMVIFGFWHDAKFTLILYGFYNGLLLVAHRMGKQLSRRFPIKFPSPLGALFSWAATFMLICLGYIPFRANDVRQAMQMLGAVITPGSYGFAQATLPWDFYLLTLFIVAGYFSYSGLAQLLLLWKNRRESIARAPALDQPLGAWAALNRPILWSYDEIAARKWWLLAPVLGLLLLLVGLSFHDNSDVAPFIYTRF